MSQGLSNNVRFVRVFLLLWVTYAAFSMSRRCLSVARADIQRETGLTQAETSFVDSAFILSYTVGQLLYGDIKKRLGNKEIILYGLLMSAVSLLCLSFSSNTWIFCLAWCLNGAAQSAQWAACLSIMSVWMFPKERGKVMGWWSTNMTAGGVIGNVLPAAIIGQGMSWRWAIAVEAVILLLLALLVFMFLLQHPNIIGLPSVQQIKKGAEQTPLPIPKDMNALNKDGELHVYPMSQTTVLVEASSSPSNNDEEIHPPSFWQIIKLPGVFGISASYFLHKLVRYGFIFWLPYFAVEDLKYTTEFAGYVTSFFDIGGLLGTVVSGYVSDWLFHGHGRTQVVLLFTFGMVLVICFFAWYSPLFVESPLLFTIAVTNVGFFTFAIDALLSGSFLLEYMERIQMAHHAGALSGVVGGIGSAGSILQGVFTVVLSSSSWTILFYSLGVATALAGVCLLRPLQIERSRK